ncbi:MAG: putative Succinyl-CoA--L-malate CoA-transferase beta subunit [Promethearchaeota archaeon]|nr:MAG: putative Succinyl-CoA--L-malate CoA-transferase beta subunit [Candidatus Lokiarchaeota archaeon]
MNLRNEKAKELFKELIAESDILVENFVKGTMERWGLGYDILKEINPRLIYCKISGYGNEGLERYTNKTAFDIIIQAEAAILDALGLKEGPPKLPIADYSAGHVAAIGISQALYYREKRGKGQFIDISMHDIMFAINMRAQAREFMPMAKSLDLGTKFLPIYNQYHTKDGLFAMTTLTERQFKRLCENILKKPELIQDSRFNNPIIRFNHVDLLDEIIEEWSTTKTLQEALELLEAERIPCGESLSMYEVHNHPNLKARGMLCDQFDFSEYNVKKATIPNRLIQFSDTPGEVLAPGPKFGQHNENIYCNLLNYSKKSLEQWKKDKVI